MGDAHAAGAAESELGADLVGAISINVDGLDVTKGFLAQAKSARRDGLRYRPPVGSDYSHWLYRGPLLLQESGSVTITRPSPQLRRQCNSMLRRTPDCFVVVYHPNQFAVVAASSVMAASNRQPYSRRVDLGTKRLDDFFVHLLDSFIGDRSISASTIHEINELASQERTRAGLLLSIQTADL